MYVLGVGTTGSTASVGILKDGKILADFTLSSGNTHSTTLLPMIENAVKVAGITLDDINLFGASIGPGSFTGLRIGVATIKGLAVKNKVPCVGVSSLQALSENYFGSEDSIVCPLIDARRERAYFAFFRIKNGNLIRLSEDAVLEIDEIKEKLHEFGEEKIHFCGDGAKLINTENKEPEELNILKGISVAKLALESYEAGRWTYESELLPVYLQKTQAERERDEKLKENDKEGK